MANNQIREISIYVVTGIVTDGNEEMRISRDIHAADEETARLLYADIASKGRIGDIVEIDAVYGPYKRIE